MRRRLPFVLVLVSLFLLSFALTTATAEPVSKVRVADAEAMATDFETLFQQLLKAQDIQPVYREHGGGFHSMSIALPPEMFDSLSPTAAAKNFRVLSAGQQLSTPSSASVLIHSALSNANSDYNYWWAVLNLSTNDRVARTTLKLAGPGNRLNQSGSFSYDGFAVTVFWFDADNGVGATGTYTLTARVTGGGNAKARTYAQ